MKVANQTIVENLISAYEDYSEVKPEHPKKPQINLSLKEIKILGDSFNKYQLEDIFRQLEIVVDRPDISEPMATQDKESIKFFYDFCKICSCENDYFESFLIEQKTYIKELKDDIRLCFASDKIKVISKDEFDDARKRHAAEIF